MGELSVLRDLVVVFALALGVVSVLRRVGVPSIAGFIVAGALVGPQSLGLVRDTHQVELLAEVGVVLLLFGIGLELSFDRLRRLWRPILVGGALQVGLTVGLAFGFGRLFGARPGQAAFLGFLVATSSTAIVLRGLESRGETDAPHGRLTLGILVFQDLCVVPMILALPLLSGSGGSPLAVAIAMGKSVLVLAGVVVLARLVVPRALHLAARTRQRDIFVLTVFLVCLGTAWAASTAGVSLALGAFLGGLVVAGSDFRHQALADLIPFREILTSLFFVSVGMLFDPRALVRDATPIAALLGAVVLGKFFVVVLVAAFMRLPARVSILAAASLAQIGEFAFVLSRAAGGTDLSPEPGRTHLTAAAILSMLITPIAMKLGPHMAAGVGRWGSLKAALRVPDSEEARESVQLVANHVIVAGYGVAGAEVARSLRETGVPCVVVDLNLDNVELANRAGDTAFYGDVTSAEVLENLGLTRARELVIVINDPDAAERAVVAARQHAPRIHICVRARYLGDAPRLLRAGATEVVPAELEVAAEIMVRVLRRFGATDETVEAHLSRVRVHRHASAAPPRRSLLAVPSVDVRGPAGPRTPPGG